MGTREKAVKLQNCEKLVIYTDKNRKTNSSPVPNFNVRLHDFSTFRDFKIHIRIVIMVLNYQNADLAFLVLKLVFTLTHSTK